MSIQKPQTRQANGRPVSLDEFDFSRKSVPHLTQPIEEIRQAPAPARGDDEESTP